MKVWNGEIQDGEIRVIKSDSSHPREKKRPTLILWLCGIAGLLLIGALAVIFFSAGETVDEEEVLKGTEISSNRVEVSSDTQVAGYTLKRYMVVNGVKLEILTPYNALPVLAVGNDVLNDSSAVLTIQAADVREDYGAIVGSRFCSIINGETTIGVADASPMFEQTLLSDGYFFRQYPLVVGGQIVENKPKGRSIRKALVEIDGQICVAISENRVSYHDFSQALIDAGASNAIALVGGDSYGTYKDSEGNLFTFGHPWDKSIDNVNYIVWRLRFTVCTLRAILHTTLGNSCCRALILTKFRNIITD